ncbi:MAG: carbohydrate-binding protein, partial [Sphingobacteriales bacterium]
MVSSGTCTTELISNVVTITVQPAISNTITGTATVCSNVAISTPLNGTPTGGSGAYSYQWQVSDDNIAFSNVATNGTSQSYTPDAIENNGPTGNIVKYYRRIVTSTGSTTTGTCLTNTSASVSVTTLPVLLNNVINTTATTICNATGLTIEASTATGGTQTMVYEWLRSTDNFASVSTVVGGNTEDLVTGNLANLTATNIVYSFKRRVTSGACNVFLESAVVQITVTPSVTNTLTAPTPATYCTTGDPAVITGTRTGGDGNYTYLWEHSTDGTVWSNVGTSETYDPPVLTNSTNATIINRYRRTVYSINCAAVVSNIVTITVYPEARVNTVTDLERCTGTNAAVTFGTNVTDPVAFTFNWTNVSAGSYTVTAKAYDNGGAVTTSGAIGINVNGVVTQTPYGGTALSIPGVVEMENYDNGGQNVAFNDISGNNEGGAYRADAVDIEAVSGGGYNVGWIAAGEWLEYTVNIKTAGTYKLEARVAATAPDKSFAVQIDGGTIATINVPNTGGWQSWTTVTVNTSSISVGTKILRVYANSSDFNVDRLTFTTVSTTNAAPSVTITSPGNNSNFNAPATITITANATDSDGSIAKVEFYNGASLLGVKSAAPYSFTWSNVAAGTYTITARAFDNLGATRNSGAVTVKANAVQSTLIQAEAYNFMSGVMIEPTRDVDGV